MSSGVKVDAEVDTAFNELKLNKTHRFYTFKIQDKKVIKVDQSGARGATYDDFTSVLPENEPRYTLIDVEFKSTDGRPTSKLVFISWNPDTASIRDKMLYSSSKESIKAAFVGVGIFINATDRSELDFETSILPVLLRFK